jgi:hypothetical protein
MGKEPLRDSPRGVRPSKKIENPKTAKELGIEIVTHATRDFATYEAIRRSPIGVPSLFISRKEKPGEHADFGNGLYTRDGTVSAHAPLPIQMRVAPNALEGVDFIFPHKNSKTAILWLTRDKLEIIPEAIDQDLAKALEMSVRASSPPAPFLFVTLKRKLNMWVAKPDPETTTKIETFVNEILADELPCEHFQLLPLFDLFASEPWSQWEKSKTWAGLLSQKIAEHIAKNISALSRSKQFLTPEAWRQSALIYTTSFFEKYSPGASMTQHDDDFKLGQLLHNVLIENRTYDLTGHPNWKNWMKHILTFDLGSHALSAIDSHVIRDQQLKDRDPALWNEILEKRLQYPLDPAFFYRPFVHVKGLANHPKWAAWMDWVLSKLESEPKMHENTFAHKGFAGFGIAHILTTQEAIAHPLWIQFVTRAITSSPSLGSEILERFTSSENLLRDRTKPFAEKHDFFLYLIERMKCELLLASKKSKP